MIWFLLSLFCVASVLIYLSVWRKWVAPWGQIQEIVEDIKKLQQPKTYLIQGSTEARRLAIALEDIFLHQLQLSRRIHEEEFSVETIIGAMADGLVVLNERGEIGVCNNSFRRLFGIEQIEPGTTLLHLLRHSVVNEAVDAVLQTSKGAEAEFSLERNSAAPPRQFALAAVPMKANGEFKGAVVLFRDVTELRRTDQIRRDFVANVSHELRTPLSIFRGYLETLREESDISRGETQRILDVMERHSRRLNALVEDLLSLAELEERGPRLQITRLDLSHLLSSIVRDWEKRFRAKRLHVQLEPSADLPMIKGDEARLHEVFYNLLDNAVKYSGENGRISLSARTEDRFVRVSVRDDGIGIPQADLSRIFERFYRVDKGRSRELGGTGLGLSIVKHIVQLHGGDVRAESEVGQGTTIHVVLPVATLHSSARS